MGRNIFATAGLCVLGVSSVLRAAETAGTGNSNALPWLAVNKRGDGFAEMQTGRKFTPWGFNYDHDRKNRLLEDYWDAEWDTVVEDFREMKQLGANVVRVHLQFAKFMDAPDKPNEHSLKQLARLAALAAETGLYLDLTGLACYRKPDTPRWYDEMNESERWQAQAKFWEAVARQCTESPAIFCYDLMNEPFVPGKARERGDWLAGQFGDFYFVQAITLDPAGRQTVAVLDRWLAQLTAAIRKHDQRHSITLGMLPISGAAFVKTAGRHLDFICVHEYPKSGKLDESIIRLKDFTVGKPLVIEEMFPLSCDADDLRQFIKRSSPPVCGWIGFYWGQTPAELGKAEGIPATMTRDWLELFQDVNPNKPH